MDDDAGLSEKIKHMVMPIKLKLLFISEGLNNISLKNDSKVCPILILTSTYIFFIKNILFINRTNLSRCIVLQYDFSQFSVFQSFI